MEFLLRVQINIILSILLFILLGHAYLNMNRKTITNRLIIGIMELTCFILILEIFGVLLNGPNLKQFIVLHRLVNIFGFLVAPVIPFLGYIFCKEWINRKQKEKIRLNKVLIIPLVINSIATLISYNGNGIFYITNENIYERGILFFTLPCVSYIYFGYTLYFIYKHREKFIYSELIIFSVFYIVPALFTGIQLKHSSYLTIWSSTAIVILIAYIFILNDQAYRDALTGLGNRLFYEQYAQNISYKRLNKLSMIYIDIDRFKAINDQYGHHEGDEAIKTFANLLVEGFPLRKTKLIRLGGDEFLILLEDQQDEVVTYIKNLMQQLEVYNNRADKEYRLGFSYGMVDYRDTYKGMYEMLECADQLMYKQKKGKKVSDEMRNNERTVGDKPK